MKAEDQVKLKSQFLEFLHGNYPGIALHDDMIAPYMLSPFQIDLPATVLQKVQRFVKAVFQARTTEGWKNHYQTQIAEKGLSDPGNYGIMMSYDFHLDGNQNPKLIEINTNASFLALGSEFYRMLNIQHCNPNFSLSSLIDCIQEEKRLFDLKKNQTHTPVKKLCIIDEKPSEQKLFSEFLLYQSFFRQHGLSCEIADLNEIEKIQSSDLIYNRCTDFYFTDEKNRHLRDLYLTQTKCFSPHPTEYFHLADKKRLEEWTDQKDDFFQQLPQWREDVIPFLLTSHDLKVENAAQLWEQRKHLFFKPRNAFGAKQSYKGASISRTLYESLVTQGLIAQELCPAPQVTRETDQGPQEFKYDLRFYVYRDEVQLCIARIYQGQVTNMRTEMGGFAPVQFQ